MFSRSEWSSINIPWRQFGQTAVNLNPMSSLKQEFYRNPMHSWVFAWLELVYHFFQVGYPKWG